MKISADGKTINKTALTAFLSKNQDTRYQKIMPDLIEACDATLMSEEF